MLDWAIGIDLGGTNIRVAKVDVLGKVSQPIFVEIDKSYADSPNFAQIISIVLQNAHAGRSDRSTPNTHWQSLFHKPSTQNALSIQDRFGAFYKAVTSLLDSL